ncbi:MAG TPA: histidine kinase, partial [Verrucomicrobiota bacterium]|nr:histidine kinase [Verrucomicrobiota bacterium]
MRSRLVIFALVVLTSLIGEVRGQASRTFVLEGVVTLADSRRGLLVIQNGDQAQAIKLDRSMPPVQVGERIKIQGRVNPHFGVFPNYPERPSGFKVLPAFETASDWNNHFLARLRGYLRVPVDGNYTFWVMADDEGELLLGSNSDPDTARLIAYAPRATWPPVWDLDPGQKSKPIPLKAGERYYIEARQREWRGHDRLVVAWESATFERKVIAAEFLSPWRVGDGATNGVLYEYWTNCFITRLAALSPESQDASIIEVSGARVESLGHGQLPVARRVATGGVRSDVPNFARVEIEGTVRFAGADDGVLNLEVKQSNARNAAENADMQIHVLNWGNRPVTHLLNRKVQARGVYERAVDFQGQPAGGTLWLQDDRQLVLMEFAESDSRELETLPMFELTPANLNLAWGRKVLVHGTVLSSDEATGKVVLRGDDSFYAYSSSDGKTWTPFGTPVPVTMNDSILAGLAASSMTARRATEARFSQVNLDMSRSTNMGFGSNQVRGSVTFSNGAVSLWPTGGNDWTRIDEGMFVCQPLEDEGEIVARIVSFNTTRISDKAGLMMRESSEADAPYVALVMTHDTRLDLLYRQSRGSVAKAVQRDVRTVPGWLRLVRRRHLLAAQLMDGEVLRVRQPVELVGLLNWTNGEPILVEAYARPAERSVQLAPADGMPRETQIADLPSTAAQSEQYLNQDYLVRGVVTFKGRAFGRELLFLQDESGAVLLRASQAVSQSERIEPGRLLEVRGGVLFTPGVPPFRINAATVLGNAVMPRPLTFPDRSESKDADSRWVEAEGIVRSVTNNVMSVMERNGPLLVWVADSGTPDSLARYVDCLVTMRGVFSLQAAPEPALLVPSPRFIEVKESAPGDPFVIPSFAINKVGAPGLNANLLHRIKITGVVTYRDEGMLVVQDQTGGARVFGGGMGGVGVGDRVEVAGFPGLEGTAVTLRESVVRKIGEAPSPEPIKMMMEGLLDGRLNSWLVRMEGIVLDQKTRQGRQLLELQSGQRVFEAVLDEAVGHLKSPPIGSRVQVTGVTQLQTASHSPVTASGRDVPIIATMDVLMRTPADLVLLERPPWWTWRHTATVGVVLVAVLIAAVGWIRSLRRRVAQRTSELQVAMSRLRKETELSATLAERERLAAEIHDTLEQGLSGIMMQLDGADTRLANDNSGARQNVEMARRMVQFSRAEVRHSLWNLESQLLKDGDLGAAIKEIARQMSTGSSTTVSVDVSDERFALPPAIEHHLLRCTQEAISNALKHSGAKNLRVKLSYKADKVELEIADDGGGVDPRQVLAGPGGPLGLRHLRSR